MYSEMDIHNNDNYIIRNNFTPLGEFNRSTIEMVFEFANSLSFSGEVEQCDHRTGGTHNRRNGEIFTNTVKGKLAEYALYNLLTKNKINTRESKFGDYKLGVLMLRILMLMVTAYQLSIQNLLDFCFFSKRRIEIKMPFILQIKRLKITHF